MIELSTTQVLHEVMTALAGLALSELTCLIQPYIEYFKSVPSSEKTFCFTPSLRLSVEFGMARIPLFQEIVHIATLISSPLNYGIILNDKCIVRVSTLRVVPIKKVLPRYSQAFC